MEVTKTQLDYLMTIKKFQNGGMSLSLIADYIGVRKSTAHNALKNLEEKGYIIKQAPLNNVGNEYLLTDKALGIVDELQKERFEFMALFYDRLGINREICEKEYSTLCGLFSKEFIEKLTRIRNSGDNCFKMKHDKQGEFFGLRYGIHALPFQVVRMDNDKRPSMGNKGFEHPATLILSENRQDIVLKSKKIIYRSTEGKKLQGELAKLCYLDNYSHWITIEKNSDSEWVIPVSNILYQRDETGKLSLGAVKIKAEASTVKMPESVAEITFNFDLI